MSISLIELYNFLNSKSNNMSDYINSIKNIQKLDSKIYKEYGFSVTNFSYNDTLNNLFFCLLYNTVIDGYNDDLIIGIDEFDRKIINYNDKRIVKIRDELSKYLNDDKYNFPFSKKKLVQLISLNQYNHELLLVLADKYNINIFIFYKDINIIKSYYSEPKLNTNKNNIFLQYTNDTITSSKTLQIMYINTIKYLLSWNDIKDLIITNKTYIYPIGIEENKIFQIDDNCGNSLKITSFFSNNKNQDMNSVDIIDSDEKEACEDLIKISKCIYNDEINDLDYYKKIINN